MISKFNYNSSYSKGNIYIFVAIFQFCWREIWFVISISGGHCQKLGSGCAIETSNLEVGTSKLSEPFSGEAYRHKKLYDSLIKSSSKVEAGYYWVETCEVPCALS